MTMFSASLFYILLLGASVTYGLSGTLCAYKNERVNDVVKTDEDEVIGVLQSDNKSVRCDGRQGWCFSFWYSLPGRDEIIVPKQGCWTSDMSEARQLANSCNQNVCNSSEPPIVIVKEAHNITSQFCCCKGDYCNVNVSNSYVPQPSTEPVTSKPLEVFTLPPKNDESWTTIIVIMVCILCLCVSIPIIFVVIRFYRTRSLKANKDHLNMIEAAPPEPSVDLDQLKVLNLVGQGRYCNCYRGLLENREVAVKIFAGASRQCYMNEVEMYSLAYVEHPNVLKCIGSCERMGEDNWPEYLLVVEFMQYGALSSYLKENTYDWHGMCRLAQTAAAGLAHLHQAVDKGGSHRPAIVHRDINSRNILVKSDLTCVIGDFGFAMKVFGSSVVREGDEDNSTITDVGTVRYMSPEVLDGAVNLRDCESALKQVDIYALGLVLWEMGTRCSDLYPGGEMPPYKLPFSDELCQHPTFEDMQVHVSRGRKRPAFPDAWKENNQALRSLKETIEDCWDHDSEARLTALCVEERIIELMILWDKHRTVSPTINPTSEGMTVATCTQSRSLPERPLGVTTVDSSHHAPHQGEVSSSDDFGTRYMPSSAMLEKNERQRLLSPDTISTSLSAQSDLNLIDLSAIAPIVDPKNLHYSDENIERFTSDLKYGRPYSTPTESSSEGYGYSEPTTSPSQPLVMHEMRPSLGGDQMTDNLGVWSKRHNLHRPTSLPVWGQLTVNEARARSHPNHSLADVAAEQRSSKPAKPDVNKQRQQARDAEQVNITSPNQNYPAKGMESSISEHSFSSKGSCSSLQSTLSEGSTNSSDSNHSRRPNTLPLPSNGHGSKKKLVAVYIPDSGPTTKVQTGIAKMDSVNPQCHPVKVATNGTHYKAKAEEPLVLLREKAQPSEKAVPNTRPLSWSVGDRSSEESDTSSPLNGNSKSRDCGINIDLKKTKRKVTPYRIGGSKKLSVYQNKSDGSSVSDESSPESSIDGATSSDNSSEHSANNNSGDQCNNRPHLTQNGHAIHPNGHITNGATPLPPTGKIVNGHRRGVTDNTFQLDDESVVWGGADAASCTNYQVSCV
ncbi:bone morphogenetic protein receptor type-2-like [Asterias rubens]|uniref:bone morphogenetic protein receptor type-2-like n=1 Tax=Asterias rubens TaxID=7604 RepID=UPI0014552CF1|nr:bone morphogenetic protein receptor type-2-like [Asterias rubens]XP_033624845.1 bone morphogenetic protein receptor type-2-like [Asterias rubens]